MESRNEQEDVLRLMKLERLNLSKVNPEMSMQLDISKSDRDAKMWVLISKRSTSRVVGYKVVDGQVEKVVLDTDNEKLRRIKLMLRDGMTLDEIESIEGRLSKEELQTFCVTRK